ncbi:DUF4272 domain-containing protein [Maribacter sp. Asnod1-A12]|uniref:DUF4272 domain-containing protein n=1 Tax=Maribacter sp. Asnod1-A12 TaxID=3160576 RepID=UPI003869ABE4
MGIFKNLFGSKDNIEPKKVNQNKPISKSYDDISWMTDLRRENLDICFNGGFKPTISLPTDLGRQLRPSIEIANRLHAIKVLVLWLMVPEENLPKEHILSFIENNKLQDFMTQEEKEILSVQRNDEQARNAIGWKFENAWPLAWYFGYKEPEISGQMMAGDQMQDILSNYTCKLDNSINDWVKDKETISKEELMQKEDLFYCVHNAVRSAQLGSDSVPSGFDPMGNGGVIHERRHSLTYMVSKGTSWEDTDLST